MMILYHCRQDYPFDHFRAGIPCRRALCFSSHVITATTTY